MVMSGIEEVGSPETGHKHQSESKGEGVASAFTPAKGSCPDVDISTKPDLQLPCLQLGEDALHRARQSQQRGHRLHQLGEELLRCQSQILHIHPQEFARVGGSTINEVKIGRQSCRNAHQRAHRPAQEGKLRRNVEGLTIQQFPDILGHFGEIQIAGLPQRHAVKLLEQDAQATLDHRHIGSLADKTQAGQGLHHRFRIACHHTEKHLSHRLFHAAGDRANHAKIDKFDDRTSARRSSFYKDVSWMRIGMEEALLKELVKIRLNRASSYLKAVNSLCLEPGIVVDFDAINPLEDQETTRGIFLIDPWNGDAWVMFEHLLEAFAVRGFRHVVDLFIHGTFKFTIDAFQINEVAGVNKARNHPDHELERAEINTHKLIDVWPLHFDSDLLSCGGEHPLMDLSKRSGSRRLAFQGAEKVLDRFAEFRFDDGDDMTEWLGRHLILERGEHGQRLLWQQVGT